MKEIKTSSFNLRINGIKNLNEILEKNKNNNKIIEKIISSIKENSIIQDIFGPNYHSQIISKSKEILKLFFLKNELNNEDFELIWNCTQKGDLEAKIIILKLLYELADNINDNFCEILFNKIKSIIDNKNIINEEIDLIYKLSLISDKKDNILFVCEYLFNYLLSSSNETIKVNHILDKILIIVQKDDIYLDKILKICEIYIKNNNKIIMCYSILLTLIDKLGLDKKLISDFIEKENLLKLFEDNFREYNKKAKELMEKDSIPFDDEKLRDNFIVEGFKHSENVIIRIDIFGKLINNIYKNYDFIPFLKDVLILRMKTKKQKKK